MTPDHHARQAQHFEDKPPVYRPPWWVFALAVLFWLGLALLIARIW